MPLALRIHSREGGQPKQLASECLHLTGSQWQIVGWAGHLSLLAAVARPPGTRDFLLHLA